ncbi:MAG: glutamine amidotransferase, partial [Hyphomicrobiales bacterium]|nr:glutamine amidotransferase [Hyphomicrobiales bacterium]
MAAPQNARILVLLHQEHSTPGRVGRLLQEMGATLDLRRPRFGDPLPATLDDHDGVVVFGGPMCANDGDDWLKAEIDWLGVPLGAGKPFLGLCLGAQMLARKLGARVFTYPDERAEVGYCPISPTAAGEALCDAPFPRCVYEWHRDGYDLPAGAVRLAGAEGAFPEQGFRYGENAIGLQFHPEVTYAMMCRWTTRGVARLSL